MGTVLAFPRELFSFNQFSKEFGERFCSRISFQVSPYKMWADSPKAEEGEDGLSERNKKAFSLLVTTKLTVQLFILLRRLSEIK